MGEPLKDFELMIRQLNPRQIVFVIVFMSFIVFPAVLGIIYYFIDTDQAALYLIFVFAQTATAVSFAWTGVPFRLPERLGGFSAERS